MHSELLRGELYWFYQQKKQVHTDHTAQADEARDEKVNFLVQLERFGLVWQLQDLADKR